MIPIIYMNVLQVGVPVYTVTLSLRHCGAYAELFAIDQKAVYRLPETFNISQGASIGIPYFTAYRALFQR